VGARRRVPLMSSLAVFALVIGSLASLAACLGAANAFVRGLRTKWIDEANADKTLKSLQNQMTDVINRLSRLERKIDQNAL